MAKPEGRGSGEGATAHPRSPREVLATPSPIHLQLIPKSSQVHPQIIPHTNLFYGPLCIYQCTKCPKKVCLNCYRKSYFYNCNTHYEVHKLEEYEKPEKDKENKK